MSRGYRRKRSKKYSFEDFQKAFEDHAGEMSIRKALILHNVLLTNLLESHLFQKCPKLITTKGYHQFGQVVSGEKGGLVTMVGIIEAAMNSRPLTLLSTEVQEIVITPSIIMIGFKVMDLPEKLVEMSYAPHTRWRKLGAVLQRVKDRRKRGYLLNKQKRFKWKIKSRNPSVGNIVLILDEKIFHYWHIVSIKKKNIGIEWF
ncbi:unnamed protein product [Lepeophtheirus salmonis]|uniref:(salmon louse) hypothetical protein n=1 Tax=Lepeophtheirus salmonis TaxID=72036 RepID=A0A7R8CIM8_LEPSM|nr:unnamed protein product [Lepeophtheirus salmonis]CAF2830312.1 unnamed protein product [Lepeophtheirus salmonis]